MTTPTTDPTYPSIAAIVPCHNEAIAIGKVVEDLRKHLPPDATVYVYDNNSTDGTDDVAREAGAVVRYEPNKGKGNVIRRAFADIDADVYLMIDGDDTYEVAAAPDMIAKLFEGPYDHVLGVRRQVADGAYRPGHDLGNRMFNRVVKQIFEVEVRDMLSGYRIFSRRFVKSFPAVSREFEIETELTVHAANLRVPQVEMEVDFRDRPDGAVSKLRTYRDGWKILTLILHLARVERPVLFHSVVAGALAVIGLLLGLPIFIEYFRTGLVPRLPTAVLASVVELVALLVYFLGLQLSALKRLKDENMRLVYLTMDAVRRPQA